MTPDFHPAAEAEFLECVGYYESRVPGLGTSLVDEYEALAKLILQSPKAWPVEIKPDIRRAPFYRFPLAIIYRGREDKVQILAIAHDRRRPQYWLGRL